MPSAPAYAGGVSAPDPSRSSEPAPHLALHAIIPAGGAGTRLWPFSRRSHPKFLRDVGTGRSLLQETVARLTPVTGGAAAGGVTVVTGVAHEAAVRAQLPELPAADLLAEPSPRDSMAAIGLAAAVLERRHGDVVVGSFAADHLITDVPAFHAAVRAAVAVAATGKVVTLGITPTHPATGFGYIHAGDPLHLPGAPTARAVLGFTEKPDTATAAGYLATGAFLWNAGMFVARARVLLDHLAQQRPELRYGIDRIADAWDTPTRAAALDTHWPTLERIAIDHAIAEPVAAAGGVAVVPADMGWDDVGDVASLAAHLAPADPTDPTSPRVLGDASRVHALDAPGAVVLTPGRDVVVLGIEDAVVIDTPDGLLVTTVAHAQDVKSVVDHLLAAGRTDLL